ncbi:type II toxin-antitoxin system VapC family toxin [Dolichospermum sp. UHCC 0684]|jgi:PIN domain nuclease of toxin-antitoxin system|uniref:type II toxin-antitoxin system VapC family toxin n=1 Tax=Dolichospermum TaxID=748770 RepID=UPI00144639AD|nr:MULTISPECIES: type II toxin-antitoxin system VapC family toxin [Dolichospermum]MBS9385644.1 type II toxin-antitoxin system VapC family toxin [Dolichospermum sp. BR01]QSV53895.1 MAG: type II toxin-antitoxin system VapC family toxin [Dolichospermum sp. UKL201]MDB9436392.1 type II toxin-antitoxin system VapC family toxin [Dolichospermum lemmermannii CS-548]MDB9452301.1 type II toxin-antitoxin system VapC family toxin [Dolichospermum circinale CS-547]MEA5530959.1 type II toxin-antitoxin system 
MKLLLDTHIFLWFISGDQRLPTYLQNSIRDLNNDVYLSCVSVWEVTVKYQLGKLPLPESPEIYLPKQRQKHLINTLTLDEESVAQLLNLPLLHRDPFDRILICQALQHNLTIVTVDTAIRAYSVNVLY